MERRERNKAIDFARAFAIICVILTHVTETTYQLQAEAVWGGEHIKLLALSLFAIGRLGVPIFLFLTGLFSFSKSMLVCKKNLRLVVQNHTIHYM